MLKKEKQKTNEEAITLIALTITIIVLLILAGVTIATLSGPNKILNNTLEAKKQTIITDVIEQVKVDVAAKMADKLGNSLNEEEMTQILDKYGELSTEQSELNDKILTTDNGSYEILVADIIQNITLEGKKFADAVKESSHYGDYVEYKIDLNGDGNLTNDWRIFYNDGERVFIIAADYVPNTSSYLDLSGAEMTTYSTYNLYWNPAPSTAQDTSQAILFGQTLWTDYNTNPSGRVVSTLLNTNNWDGFVDSNYADYAIGGSTLELWVESYNAKGYTPLFCNNINKYGYYIGNISSPTTVLHTLDKNAQTGYNDTLYFPHQGEEFSDCLGYWLASPNANNEAQLMSVFYYYDDDIYITSNYYTYYFLGMRPVVSLKSTLTATQNTSGVWELSN